MTWKDPAPRHATEELMYPWFGRRFEMVDRYKQIFEERLLPIIEKFDDDVEKMILEEMIRGDHEPKK